LKHTAIAIEGTSLSIPIVAGGKGWLVVDKPAGMTVHNVPGRDVCSLALKYLLKQRPVAAGTDGPLDLSVSPVHRLDKDASGILLLATTSDAFRFLSRQFESRQVKKRYTAMLHGILADPKGNGPWGTWGWPLAKKVGGRRRPQGTGQRQPAETRYRILDRSGRYTMVEIDLLTGRKHQIRRHAKLSGHAVVGDARYGSKRSTDFLRNNLAFSRLALHAHSITLLLPERATPGTIAINAVPDAIRDLLTSSRRLGPSG